MHKLKHEKKQWISPSLVVNTDAFLDPSFDENVRVQKVQDSRHHEAKACGARKREGGGHLICPLALFRSWPNEFRPHVAYTIRVLVSPD